MKPLTIRRMRRRAFAFYCLILALFIVSQTLPRPWAARVAFCACAALVTVQAMTMFFWRPRLSKRVMAHGYSLCLRCERALRDAGESGPCPACEEPYDLEHVRDEWKKWA